MTPDEAMLGRRAGQVLVRPSKSPLAGQAIRELSARAKVGGWVARKFPALGGIQVIGLPKGASVDRALAELRASGAYEYAEPDYVVMASDSPNDPDFISGKQWGLNNAGQDSGVADADIDAPEGWSTRTDATGAIIAVIDTGVRYTHEDLAANMWRNPGESGDGKETNGLDDDGDGYIDDVFGINATDKVGNIPGSKAGDPMDDNGHGTHVAGTAGAVGNNGLGGSGVAWSAKIMACKFLNSSGSGAVSDAIECINYARLHGAKVMNNSWGGGAFSQALLDAIRSAGDAGAIFVAAAGNASTNIVSSPSYPAAYLAENVLAVAGTARDDGMYSYSNYGFGIVDIAAPGQDIYSTYGSADNAYAWMSGTSMATPHVSGVAALLLSQFPSDTHPRQTINRILRSAEPAAALEDKTTLGGRINLAGALASTSSAPFNDSFADACEIPVVPAMIRTSNRFASSEPGEPSHAGAAPSNTLWWKWVATSSGEVQLKTSGSGFDTVLAVYSGDALATLAGVAANDDAPGGGTTSSLKFAANQGTTYYFVVGGKTDAAVGLMILTLSNAPPPPTNDAFACRIALTGPANLVIASNLNATSELGEPLNTSESGMHSVWWEWTAPQSGRVEIVTEGSDFDTTVGVYSGSAVGSLAAIDQNDDVIGGFLRTSRVVFTAQAGEKYQISVDGWAEEIGTIWLWLTMGEAPANDNLTSAAQFPAPAVTGTGARTSASAVTSWAGREPDEPNHAGRNGTSSAWWSWMAPASGLVTVDTDNSDFYTVLGIYQGSSVNALSFLACDEPDTVQSHITFPAVAGQTYLIAVDGYERSAGTVSLHLALANSRPSVTSAATSAGSLAFDDLPISLSAIIATDPELDAIALSYQWQSSSDGAAYSDAAGEAGPALGADGSRSGKFWRCRIAGSDALGAGAPFFTSPVAMDNRPPSIASDEQSFFYDCDLPGTGSFSLAQGSGLPAGLSLDPSTGELSGIISEPSGGLFHVRIARGSLERAFDLLVGTAGGVYFVPPGRTWTPSGPVSLTGQLVVQGAVAEGAEVALTQTYSAWRAVWFGTPGDLHSGNDADGDGMNDFAEFAFGGNPLLPDSHGLAPSAGTVGSPGYATLTFRRQKPPSTVVYQMERSSNLVDWTLVDPVANAVGAAASSGQYYEILTIRDSVPLSNAPSFLRLRTSVAP